MTHRDSPAATHTPADRQHWMAVLARADVAALETYYRQLTDVPGFRHLRTAETGLAMVRARTGGTGAPFNLGEVTVSRCVVQLDTGTRGFGYVRGRNRRHAELAALLDALLQDAADRHVPALIAHLHRQWQQQRETIARKAAATRVDFMTMVRGS